MAVGDYPSSCSLELCLPSRFSAAPSSGIEPNLGRPAPGLGPPRSIQRDVHSLRSFRSVGNCITQTVDRDLRRRGRSPNRVAWRFPDWTAVGFRSAPFVRTRFSFHASAFALRLRPCGLRLVAIAVANTPARRRGFSSASRTLFLGSDRDLASRYQPARSVLGPARLMTSGLSPLVRRATCGDISPDRPTGVFDTH